MDKVANISVVMVGAGNLATHLAKNLQNKGFSVVQVYSRTEASAKALAGQIGAKYTTQITDLYRDAQLYICSLKDDALLQLIPQLTTNNPDALWLHTAGSIPMQVWKGYVQRYGVLYPLQTFSKHREVNFNDIPLFVEANNPTDLSLIEQVARKLSCKVYRADSEQRKSLHLAAVFACNFTNHLYDLANELLIKNNLPFEALLPLIDETANKVHELAPRDAQTGPAVRYDRVVMDNHISMLSDAPDMQRIYRLLSESIHNRNKK